MHIPTVNELEDLSASESALLLMRILNTQDGMTKHYELLKLETLGDLVNSQTELVLSEGILADEELNEFQEHTAEILDYLHFEHAVEETVKK